jgi:hypothetical protein
VNTGKQFKKESEMTEDIGDFSSVNPHKMGGKKLKENTTKKGNMYLRLIIRTSLIILVFK